MSLSLIKMTLNIKCNQCGRCCKFWDIVINVEDMKRIVNLGYNEKDFCFVSNGRLKLIHKKDGGCVFLEKDNLCKIQKNQGFKSKPDVCRHFPYDDLICGAPELSKKKKNKYSLKTDFFFNINNKKVYTNTFLQLFNQVDIKKSLFDSYCELLINIINQKEEIIHQKFKLKRYDLLVSKELIKKIEWTIVNFETIGYTQMINKLLKRPIQIKMPCGKIYFKFEKATIPDKTKKEFLRYISKEIKRNNRDVFYLIKIMIFFYYLPYFVASTKSKDSGEAGLLDLLRAFSLLNSINRFNNLKRIDLVYLININLNNWIKETKR